MFSYSLTLFSFSFLSDVLLFKSSKRSLIMFTVRIKLKGTNTVGFPFVEEIEGIIMRSPMISYEERLPGSRRLPAWRTARRALEARNWPASIWSS